MSGLSKRQKLNAGLAILETKKNDWCESIKRDRSVVNKYVRGERVKPNPYIDHKIDQLWNEALTIINKEVS